MNNSQNTQTGRMSNLQLELLKLYATDIPEGQLQDIKRLLAAYFAELIDRDIVALWEANNWNQSTIEGWKQEHLRTPYK